jgi:hypothetical protein
MLQNIDACAGERVSGRSAEDATAGARAAAAIGEGEEAIEAVAGDGGLRWARGRQTYRCRCNACESAGGGIDAGDGAGVARSEEGRGYKSARTGRRGNSVQFTLATVWGKRDVARYAQAESPKSCCTNFGSQEGDCFPFMIYPPSPQPSSSPSAGDRCRAVKRRVCCCAELFQEKSHECTVCRHAVTPRFSLLTTIDLSGCKANTCAVCRYASMHTRSLWLAAFLRATANMHRGNHFATAGKRCTGNDSPRAAVAVHQYFHGNPGA